MVKIANPEEYVKNFKSRHQHCVISGREYAGTRTNESNGIYEHLHTYVCTMIYKICSFIVSVLHISVKTSKVVVFFFIEVYACVCVCRYKAGDVVLMTPINTLSGSVPGILHLKWNNPHMLMDFKCLKPMGIVPGQV